MPWHWGPTVLAGGELESARQLLLGTTAPLHLRGTGRKSPSYPTHLFPTVSLAGTPGPTGTEPRWVLARAQPGEDEGPAGARAACPTLRRLGLHEGFDEQICGLSVEGQGVAQRLQVRALLQERFLQAHATGVEVLLEGERPPDAQQV